MVTRSACGDRAALAIGLGLQAPSAVLEVRRAWLDGSRLLDVLCCWRRRFQRESTAPPESAAAVGTMKRKKPPARGGKTKKALPAPTGRAAIPAIMERARAVARQGLCMGFKDVAQALGEDGKTLRLWAGASERDELDRICDKARAPMRRR